MSTIVASNLQASGGGGTAATLASINGGAIAGHRNRLINGAMAIDQRNAGAAQTFTAGAALVYCVDRWFGYAINGSPTGQQVTGATAGQFRYRFTGAASTTTIGFGQRIEQLHSADLAGTTATLSVDLANSLVTTVTWTVFYANTADTFGTKTQIATGNFNVNSTVTRYSTQIAIPAAATTGIEILFTVTNQTSGTWTIGDVQFERGSVATPFERRNQASELMMCLRYFQWFGAGTSGQEETATTFSIAGAFMAPMRTFPVPTFIGTTFATRLAGAGDRTLAGVSITSYAASTQAAWILLTNSGGNVSARFIQERNATSTIQMSAEL